MKRPRCGIPKCRARAQDRPLCDGHLAMLPKPQQNDLMAAWSRFQAGRQDSLRIYSHQLGQAVQTVKHVMETGRLL